MRGNARLQGEARQKEGGGVFDSGSRTPVAISLFIKCGDTKSSPSLAEGDKGGGQDSMQNAPDLSLLESQSTNTTHPQTPSAREGALTPKKAKIFYYDIGDYLDRQTKLNIIQNFHSIEGIERQQKWQIIHPNKDYDWIN